MTARTSEANALLCGPKNVLKPLDLKLTTLFIYFFLARTLQSLMSYDDPK